MGMCLYTALYTMNHQPLLATPCYLQRFSVQRLDECRQASFKDFHILDYKDKETCQI